MEGITRLQNNGLDKVIIYDCKFLQVRASSISNVWRDLLVNGTMDNNEINRNHLGIGGAGVPIVFDECSLSTSIELKFCKILDKIHFQVWGPSPMKRNLFCVLYWSQNASGKWCTLKNI